MNEEERLEEMKSFLIKMNGHRLILFTESGKYLVDKELK